MDRKEALAVVTAMITAGKISVPAYNAENPKQWAADVRRIVEKCVVDLVKAPAPRF